jgi:hypothetical protein
MEFKIFNSEQYLKKNKPNDLESDTDERILASIKELCEPLYDVAYDNCGEVKIGKDEESINFSFDFIDEEIKHILRSYFELGGANKDYISDRLDTKQWRLLNEYTIENTTDSETASLDILKLVSPGYKILFFPQKEFVNACAINSPNHKLVLFVGDMSAPVAPIVLLHEIGHVVDFNNLEEAKTDKFVTDSPYSPEAEKLRKERTATALALKTLRPLFKNSTIVNKQKTMDFLRLYALNTYHENIESLLISKGFYGQISSKLWRDIDREYLEDMEIGEEMERQYAKEEEVEQEEFEKWKGTEEYTEWKKLERNRDDLREFYKWKKERELKEYFERWKNDNFRTEVEKFGGRISYGEWKEKEENKQLSGYQEFYKWLVNYEKK